MLHMQFHYYMDKYQLKKYFIDGKEVFFLYDLQLTFHEYPERSYTTVKGFIPYLLALRLPEVDPTPEQYLDPSKPFKGKIEDWVSGKPFGDYLSENLIKWEVSQEITTSELLSQIRQKKAELLAEHPEDFYLLNCHFFTIDGLTAFLKETIDFYNKK